MINRLEVALASWRTLTKHERAQFLILHNEFYDQKRAAAWPVVARCERLWGWRGGALARDGEALHQDRPVDG